MDLRQTLSSLDESGSSQLIKQIAEAAPDQRRKLMNEMIQIVDEVAAADPISSPTGATPPGMLHPRIVGRVAYILSEIGDEPTILAAFVDNLPRLSPHFQHNAAAALANCHDPAGVKAIEELIRDKVKSLPENLSDDAPDEVMRNIENLSIDYIMLLKRLAQSVNSSGRIKAIKLREEFAEEAKGSWFREKILVSLDAEVGSLLEKTPKVKVAPEPNQNAPVPKPTFANKQPTPDKKPAKSEASDTDSDSDNPFPYWIFIIGELLQSELSS